MTRAFSAEEVKHFVLLTGDANPIHASDVAAKTAGMHNRKQLSGLTSQSPFESRRSPPPHHPCVCTGFSAPVLPGILVASLFPAIIGSQFPGTVYVSQTLRFRSPALVSGPPVAVLVY